MLDEGLEPVEPRTYEELMEAVVFRELVVVVVAGVLASVHTNWNVEYIAQGWQSS
jgi:hypothetical protein